MKLITHNIHKDISRIYVNKCVDRNFYCPRSLGDPISVYKGGSRFISLNGEYEFAYFAKNEEFNENVHFDKITVPSCWQTKGFGKTAYLNDRYIMALNPPFVEDSDYGVYKKRFILSKKQGQRYYLNFEGKDSCLYVYLNGQFVGFDSVSHCTSEFDVTDFLVNGENELIIFVYVFSVGTYFECQDKFRLSGLFRDVYLLEREEGHIESYKIRYFKINKKDIQVNIDFVCPSLEKIVEICGENIKVSSCDNSISLVIKNAKLWNAEEPNLYTIKIQCNNEVIYDYLLFRFVEIKNGVFLLNDTKIKILGVNHHDSKYETGYYLSLDDLRNDIKLIKDAHLNGVRTSHYPPAPEFLYLCDEAGLYVIDEADIECHGSTWLHGSYDINDFDGITDNPIFDEVIKDRIMRLITRDFNRGSILFWSGGNEAGYGQVMIKYLKQLKEIDPSRLVHYESLYTGHPDRNNYKLDIISQMYSSYEKINETLKNDTRPLVLCEYCHAMGNSCGDISDYIDCFYSSERIIGGFIWEFNDHCVAIGGNKNKPGYGGDFNEAYHDGNFCVDGLINYKREPSTNYYEIKAAHSKLVIIHKDDGYYLLSRFDFINKYNVVVKVNEREIIVPEIKPREEIYISSNVIENIVFSIYLDGSLYSKYSFINKEKKHSESIESDAMFLNGNEILLKNANLTLYVSKKTGLISHLYFDKKEIINGSLLTMLRAPIDNDRYEIESWKEQGLFSYETILDKFEIKKNALEITVKCSNVGKGKITYIINQNKLHISIAFVVNENVSYLPRFGYQLFIDKSFDKYSYLGFGPYESYCDKKHLDIYSRFVDYVSSEIPYIKPQECMSHLVEEVELSNSSLTMLLKGMNSFSYLPFSIDELKSKKHNYDLMVDENRNYLSLDYMMSGVGSHACGPELLDKYKLKEKNISMRIELEVR